MAAEPTPIGRQKFEPVYTCTDWYDGPRGGIAEFCGESHLFQSDFTDLSADDPDTFLLMPLGPDVVRLAREDWDIWRRWESAFYLGHTTKDTHPALPEDRARQEEVSRLLDGKLVADPARSTRARAEFRPRSEAVWSGHGMAPLKVRWTPLAP